MSIKILPISTKTTVDSYPYGRLRATAYFSIEFKKGKGYRTVFQTINPKTNRLNKPKASTYSNFACQCINEDNGHVENIHFSINGDDEINKVASFIAEHFETLQLSKEQVTELCKDMHDTLVIGLHWTNPNLRTQVRAVFADVMELLKEGVSTGVVDFKSIKIDTEKIKSIKQTV